MVLLILCALSCETLPDPGKLFAEVHEPKAR